MIDLSGLPGAELVETGMADLAAGRRTVPALLVAAAGARLRRLGLPVPTIAGDAEIELHRELERQQPDGAYGRYNALLRRISSFASALEREHGQALRAARADAERGS